MGMRRSDSPSQLSQNTPRRWVNSPDLWATLMTLGLSALGAWLGWMLGFPAYLITGPAIAVTLGGLVGLRLDIHKGLRDVVFVVIGVGIGSTVTEDTVAAMAAWPLAFVVLAISLAVTMSLSGLALRRMFGQDPRAAVLACAPGHLSFVIGLSAELKVDTVFVTVAQSVRLLSLTLAVPIMARLMGVELRGLPLGGGEAMPWGGFAILCAAGVVAGFGMLKLRVPAALLVGSMAVSSVAHGGGMVHGGLNPALALVCFAVLGGMIGTRFSGVTLRALRDAMGAGLAVTAIGCTVALVAAVPVAWLIGMPATTVLAGFAPGGFETMIALGAVLGANPGFVAGAHVARLLVLTALVPWFLSRAERGTA